jgi:hypothetical protein
VIGLAVASIYADLTPAFLPQALAQDIANLMIASPALLILAVLALRGSLRAYLLWLGVLTFTVYNYVIYTFSIPFGSLFLLRVAVLGCRPTPSTSLTWRSSCRRLSPPACCSSNASRSHIPLHRR